MINQQHRSHDRKFHTARNIKVRLPNNKSIMNQKKKKRSKTPSLLAASLHPELLRGEPRSFHTINRDTRNLQCKFMVTQRKTVTFPVNNRQNYTKDIVNNQSYQKIIGLHDYLLQSIYVEEEACGKKKSSNGPARVYPIERATL